MHPQSGQSLIETIAAIFILVTALSTAVGLAIYSFSVTTASQHQVTAINLAREGVDVIRAMRDSNWLASDKKDPDGSQSWGLQVCNDISNTMCYPVAYNKIPSYNDYDLDAGSYQLKFNALANTWQLDTGNYNLYSQPDGSYIHDAAGNSVFARQVLITTNTNPPYTNQNSNWELIIRSTVLWRGKGCANFIGTENLSTINSQCKVVAEEHLTNWKDYK
jgi:hypothetical protein